MIYEDLFVYPTNVAAMFLATVKPFRYAYKRNQVATLALE